MRAIGVSLGLCLGFVELVSAIVFMQAVAQIDHPMTSVYHAVTFALTFLAVPGLTVAGALLGLRYGLAGGLTLLTSTVTLLAVLGVGPITDVFASAGAAAGVLLVVTSLHTRTAP